MLQLALPLLFWSPSPRCEVSRCYSSWGAAILLVSLPRGSPEEQHHGHEPCSSTKLLDFCHRLVTVMETVLLEPRHYCTAGQRWMGTSLLYHPAAPWLQPTYSQPPKDILTTPKHFCCQTLPCHSGEGLSLHELPKLTFGVQEPLSWHWQSSPTTIITEKWFSLSFYYRLGYFTY